MNLSSSKFQPDAATAARQRWMALLARAGLDELETAWRSLQEQPCYAFLRRPETGLVMLRGRAGGSGHPFNVGEMTVTRCAVRLADGACGHGYVAGRSPRRAELAALFDALMQDAGRRAALEERLTGPVERRLAEERRHKAAKTAATRVDFFTLVRGEDE